MDVELGQIDRDGAIPDALERVGLTRAQVLRRTAGGLAGVAAAGGLLAGAPAAFAKKGRATDLTVLQLALVFEHLGATFYTEAVAGGALSGETLRFAETLREHELAHVAFVQKAIRGLGGTPKAPPTFHFGRIPHQPRAFRRTSESIEQLCVEVINGAGPLVTRPVLAAAGELVSVEARHVAWIRQIRGETPAPAPFDGTRTAAQAERIVKRAGFVKSF